MAFSPESRWTQGAPATTVDSAVVDAGLRAYMLRVYNWMSSGLVLTGIMALLVANTDLINLFYGKQVMASGRITYGATLLGYIAMFAPLGFVLVLSFGINKLSTTAAQALFWAFAAVMGISMSNIFLIYTGTSIATTFFVTAGTFAAMSIIGYTTQRDLTKMGSFLMMGLIGLILAMVVNMFLQSAMMGYVISAIGVLIFVGLIAYDTQRIKGDYISTIQHEGQDMAAKRSVYDALTLYLDFINLFQFLLSFMGRRD